MPRLKVGASDKCWTRIRKEFLIIPAYAEIQAS